MVHASEVMAGILALSLVACSGGDGGEPGPASVDPKGLGEPCGADAECIDGRCAFGTCHHDCRGWAECVGEVGRRDLSCLAVPGMDAVADFRPGACPLPAELACASDAGCPGAGNGCDPNGVCRMTCGTADDCVLHDGAERACVGGLCFDGADAGWSRVSADVPAHEAPPVPGRVVFEPSALTEPMDCVMAPLVDDIFHPADQWGWPYGQLGVTVQCHRVSDDQGLWMDETPRPAAISFPLRDTPLDAGMAPSDVALCGSDDGCDPPTAWDAGAGVATWRTEHPLQAHTPMVTTHITADLGGAALSCWVNPTFGNTAGTYSLRSWPAGVGQAHREQCWPGSFELRVVPGALAAGTHDLSDPAVRAAVDVGLELDGLVYGVLGGVGDGAGTTGTLVFTAATDSSMRLIDATLVAADGAGGAVHIDEALLFRAP